MSSVQLFDIHRSFLELRHPSSVLAASRRASFNVDYKFELLTEFSFL